MTKNAIVTRAIAGAFIAASVSVSATFLALSESAKGFVRILRADSNAPLLFLILIGTFLACLTVLGHRARSELLQAVGSEKSPRQWGRHFYTSIMMIAALMSIAITMAALVLREW